MRIVDGLDACLLDLRLALRRLAREPVLAVAAVLILGLGIGANTTIFRIFDAVLLRPLPVSHPERLVAIGVPTAIDGHTTGSPRGDLLSLPLYRELRERSGALVTGLAATGTAGRLDVRIGAGAFEHPAGRFVSANYFAVLGVPAEHGRVFGAPEDGPVGASPAAVISDAYWRARFGAASDVVGRTIEVDGTRLTIVGVARQGFSGDVVDRATDVWLPIEMQPVVQPHSPSIEDRATSWLLLLGRLAPGVTLTRADAGFRTLIRASLVANATSAYEREHARRAPTIVTAGARGFSAVRASFRPALVTLQAGVGLLLLIVCFNLANLLLARAVARTTEMSVRRALGATGGRLVRQLMTEHALLAALGCALGLALAGWVGRVLLPAATSGGAPIDASGIDGPVLAFTLSLATLAVLAFGLAPALRGARSDLSGSMRAGARSIVASGRGSRIPIGRLLIPAQVALSFMLLTGTALLTRSLRNIEAGNPGLDRDHLLIVDLDATRRGLAGDRFLAVAGELSDRVAALPGVRAVTYSQNGLFSGHDAGALVSIPGFTGRDPADSLLDYDLVGPRFLAAVGARLLRGRDLDERDGPRSPSVAVVNRSMERFYFGGASALGRVLYFDPGVPTTIVGVVEDIHDRSMTRPADRRAYAPYAQQLAGNDHPSLSLEIRTAGDPAALARSVQAAIAAVDPDLPIETASPLAARMRDSIREQRLLAALATAFGLAALLLAALGLYGVMAYSVARRTGELGLRAALGADRAAVLGLVLRDGLRLALLGVLVGLPLALGSAYALRAQLHGVPAADPASLTLALTFLLACAAAAALVPAVQAARVSPATALTRGA